jgi:hypothetical protein
MGNSVVEIAMAIINKVVASNPLQGWQPTTAWSPVAVELISATEQSKQATPTVPDLRLDLRVNGMTVKTYQSSLLALWQEVSKEPLWVKGSTAKMGILNPKLKIGYTKVEGNEKYPFKMICTSK